MESQPLWYIVQPWSFPLTRKLTEPILQVKQLTLREPELDPVVTEWEQLRSGWLLPLVE